MPVISRIVSQQLRTNKQVMIDLISNLKDSDIRR